MSRVASVRSSQRQYVQNSPARLLARTLPGIRPAPFPDFIEPALATLHDRAPAGDVWVHEIKFDGYRLQLRLREGMVQFLTRRGHDWSGRFGGLAKAAWSLLAHAAVLDGEVIVPAADGLSDFGALQSVLSKGRCDGCVFYAFDLMHLDGMDLRGVGLVDRKRVLAELLSGAEAGLLLSEHMEGDGPEIYRNACQLGLEGVVSKRRNGRYVSGRTDTWMKATCRHRETFPVIGYATKNGKFDGVYLGREEGRELVYAGKVEHGFDSTTARDIVDRLKPLVISKPPIAGEIDKPKATWARPAVLADVEFRALTGEGLMRHPSFKGVREDLMQPAPRRPARARGKSREPV